MEKLTIVKVKKHNIGCEACENKVCPRITGTSQLLCTDKFNGVYRKAEVFKYNPVMPKITYVSGKIIPVFRAFALPYFGIFINEKYKGDNKIVDHEFIHLQQIKRMTLPIYIMRYIFQLLFIGYDSMPMEIEARQTDISPWNYRKRNWTKH